MTKVKEDISRVRLEVKGQQAISELGKLEMQAKELTIDIKNAKEGTDAYVAANKKLAEVQTRIAALRKEIGLAGLTMSQLTKYQSQLKMEMNKGVTEGTARYKELNIELQKVNAELARQRDVMNGTSGFFSKMKKELRTFGMVAVGYLGFQALLGGVTSLISGAGKLSDELTDVAKVTGFTDEQMKSLSSTISNMDTRTSRSELRALAEIAGRLGLQSVKDVEGFVKAADKLNVALGDQLGDPEIVMKKIGKLASVFKVTEEFGIEKALLKVGSAINDLGMASTASEGYMVEFAKRLGGVAPLAGISIQNVLGLGAALDSLGQTSEVSTTALSKLFLNMAKGAGTYAKYARMETSAFVKLLKEDANEAFLRMLQGVKNNSKGIVELASTLGDLGEDGGRVIGVIGTLANNIKHVRIQQIIANKAFEEGTSVTEEYNKKNENLAANLAKIGKWLHSIFMNSAVMNGINLFAEGWANWLVQPVSEKLEEERQALAAIQIKLESANLAQEDRIKLVATLQAKYPQYFSQMSTEKASLENISKAIYDINEQLLNKIVLQKKDEEIQSTLDRAANMKIDLLDKEKSLRQKMGEVAEKYNLKILKGIEIEKQAENLYNKANPYDADNLKTNRHGEEVGITAQLNKELQEYTDLKKLSNQWAFRANMLAEERLNLAKQLNITLKEPGADGDFKIPNEDEGYKGPKINIIDDKDAKKQTDTLEKLKEAWQKYKDKIIGIKRELELGEMESDEKEKGKVRDKYKELESELTVHYDNKIITEKMFKLRKLELKKLENQELDAINLAYKEKEDLEKENAFKKLDEYTMDARELARNKLEEHYNLMLEMATKFGYDKEKITEQYEKAVAELALKHRTEDLKEEESKYKAKIEMAKDFAEVAMGVMGLMAGFSGDVAKYDRTIAISKALINSGVAIAEMIKNFSATSLTPIDLAAKIAAGTGIVLTNINSAIRTINRTTIDKAPTAPSINEGQSSTGRGRVTTAPKKRRSFYFGGYTGEGMGIGDQYGEFAGFVHKKEYVIPEIVTKDPRVANLLPAIESIRKEKVRGFYNGGDTGGSAVATTAPPMSGDPEVKALLRIMINKLDAMPKNIKAYMVYREFQEFSEEAESLQKRFKV